MRIAFAALFLVALYAVAVVAVRRARRRPLALAAPIALAVVVCFEALALRGLSLVQGVTATGVVLVHLGAIAMAASILARRTRPPSTDAGTRPRLPFRRGALLPALVVAPILLLVVLSSARYAPNSWDSMTYHLARVAHWIQRASVEAYYTGSPRQNVLAPGAEYLLLVLQVVARSDALANFLQLACWLVMVIAAAPLARLAGAPRRAARWAGVLLGAAPMAVLQASSTQNDLVASVLALAIVAASTPFLHRARARWTPADVLLLGAAVAGAGVVKTTAVLAAAPWLAVVAVRAASGLLGDARRRLSRAGAIVASVALLAVVAGPSLTTATEAVAGSHWLGAYTYPVWGDWGSRITNVARGTAHHLPVPRPITGALGLPTESCGAFWCTSFVSTWHEDIAGNGPQAAVLAVLLAVAVARWRRLPSRARVGVVAPLASWFLFHLFLRENTWISRLQLPTFALSLSTLAALSGVRFASRVSRASLGAVAVLLAGVGAAVAASNVSRPPLTPHPSGSDRAASRYLNRPDVRPGHEAALATAVASGCRRVGLVIGMDSYDYPLTWRVMLAGSEARHVLPDDRWPCVLFIESPPPPDRPGSPWLPTDHTSVFVQDDPGASRR